MSLKKKNYNGYRLAAKEISSLLPALKEANVRLVGVGLEKLGVEEFIEGKFFDGDLFVDADKSSFKALGFQKMSKMGLTGAVFSKKARDAKAKADKLKLGGNIKGDWYQYGGALVVEAGGANTLLVYMQKEAPDHVDNEDVVKVRILCK